MSRPEIRRDQTQAWILAEGDDGPVLEVLCGTIGMFERCLPLNSEEQSRLAEGGDSYLDTLAVRIRRQPERFGDRFIK